MVWRIELTESAKKQLSKIGKSEAKRITAYLHNKIQTLDNPRQLGIAMQGSKSNLWRYRVGDYRIIAGIDDERIRILVVRIGHRREVYRE